MKIEGQGAVVTGASRGLGRALAEVLAAKGARVAMVAREAGPLGDAVATIRARGGIAHAVVGDIGDKDAVHKIAGQAQGLVGEVGIVIHNASTLGPVPLRLLLDTECEDLAAVLETNLVGPFRLTKILAGAMALRGNGVVVHLSSDAAVELADTGMRVLAIDPGEMDTKMHADAIPDADRATLQRPHVVAARLVAMIEDAARAPSGARLLPAWGTP